METRKRKDRIKNKKSFTTSGSVESGTDKREKLDMTLRSVCTSKCSKFMGDIWFIKSLYIESESVEKFSNLDI